MGIHPTAIVASTAHLGEDVEIVANTARFDGGGVVNDGTAGSQYVQLVNFTTNPDTSTPSAALTDDSSSAAPRPLGAGSGAIAGTDPGLPQSVDLQTSAVNNATRIEGPLLINVAGLTTDTEDRLMASAAIIGLSSRPNAGYSRPAATGTPSAL